MSLGILGASQLGVLQIRDVKEGCGKFINIPDMRADGKLGGFGTECQTLDHK